MKHVIPIVVEDVPRRPQQEPTIGDGSHRDVSSGLMGENEIEQRVFDAVDEMRIGWNRAARRAAREMKPMSMMCAFGHHERCYGDGCACECKHGG